MIDDDLFGGGLPKHPRPPKSKTWKQAHADRTTGMAHAESGQDEWMEAAVEFACGWVLASPRSFFMTEDVVEDAKETIPQPRDLRAWGPVMKRVETLGYISKAGYAPARTSNTSPKVRWQKR